MTATTSTTIIADGERGRRPTRIDVELVDGRARICTLDQGYFLAARPLQTSDDRVRIALIGVHMTMLGGDDVDLRVQVGEGVTLEIVEPVGMVAYDADGQRSTWRLAASVGTGATLIWHGGQFVAAQGSHAHRSTELTLGRHARALIKETLVLGRSGESHAELRSRLHVRLGEQELLVEDLDLTEDTRVLPGIVGAAKVLSTVVAAGLRPDGDRTDPHRLDLAGPGALFRSLDAAAHCADELVEPVFKRWRSQALTREKS